MSAPIGILGGTFDPIHAGHIHLALQALDLLNLKEVRLIPSYQPVHRQLPVASATDRFEMLKLAIADHPKLIADDTEIKRGGASYMIDTLSSLRKKYPNSPLCLILSADAFNEFLSWKDWSSILNFSHIVVANRPNHPIQDNPPLMNFLNAHVTQDIKTLHSTVAGAIMTITIEPLLISATDIREQLASNQNPQHLVIPKVWQYIKKHHLYGV